MRSESAMTTKALREKPFELLVAPGLDGAASGELYIDDGDSIEQDKITYVQFDFKNDKLTISGKTDYKAKLDLVIILNQSSSRKAKVNGKDVESKYDASKKCITVSLGSMDMQEMTVELSVSSCSVFFGYAELPGSEENNLSVHRYNMLDNASGTT